MRSLGRKLTVLILPSAGSTSLKVNLDPRWIAAGLASWLIVTLWAGWMVYSHSDYISTKAEAHALRGELDRSREDLERVREADKQLRAMLQMGGKKALIEQATGEGGAERAEMTEFRRRQAAILAEEARKTLVSFEEISGFIDRERRLYRATPQGWPTLGRLTSKFGRRRSPVAATDDEPEFHAGLDIANKPGTLILATADGVVKQAGWVKGYGQMVLIRHDGRFSTLFGHTSKLLVRAGQRIERGQPVALMGNTGRSTGPHLHYEVWRLGRPVDPRKFLGSYRD